MSKLLLRIQEIPISNLGSETGHLDLNFTIFFSVSQSKP
jgi:hypothetical protein